MNDLTFPERFPPVQAHEPGSADAMDNTCAIISLKNVSMLWAVFHFYGAGSASNDLIITWNESTDVAGGTTAAITETCPIWYNIDTATIDGLTRATDAYTFTIAAATQLDQIWVMGFDPAKFSDGYDCFQFRSSGGNAGNYIEVMYYPDMLYQSNNPPSLITD